MRRKSGSYVDKAITEVEDFSVPPYMARWAAPRFVASTRGRLSSIRSIGGLVMATTRYEPWGVVSQLQSEINRVFGNLNDGDSSSATAEWSPAVDVLEYSDRFQLLLDVPGVEPKEVEITLDNGVLTISGIRNEEKTVETAVSERPQQQRIERRFGRFHRRFILPDTVDAENVNASG